MASAAGEEVAEEDRNDYLSLCRSAGDLETIARPMRIETAPQTDESKRPPGMSSTGWQIKGTEGRGRGLAWGGWRAATWLLLLLSPLQNTDGDALNYCTL